MPDPSRNNFYYLLMQGTRYHIETSSTSLEMIMKNIASSKKWYRQSRYMVKAKAKDEKVKRIFLHQRSIIEWIVIVVDTVDAYIQKMLLERRMV